MTSPLPKDEAGGPPSALERVRDDAASRKSFMKMVGGAGAAGALSLLLAACGNDDEGGGGQSDTGASTPAPTSTPMGSSGDIEIVNYALTLEYLEAEFYAQVITSGQIKDKKVVELAKIIGKHEQDHVDALKQTVEQLGGTAAEKPQTNFDDVLSGGAMKILETAATVENLGAAAYLGQAGRIENPEILAAALSIHTVEARHAAALNHLVGRGFSGGGKLSGSLPDGAFAKPMSMDEVLEQAKPFLA